MTTTREGRNGGPQITRTTAPVVELLERRSAGPMPMLAYGASATYPGKTGWHACVRDQGATLYLSKLNGEDEWVIDGLVPAGTSMPRFMHGWGSRCTRLYHPTETVAGVLDAAVAARLTRAG
jgi:hypothetical protein